MPRIGSYCPAEEFLSETGVIKRRSIQRQAIIGCIGCRWLKAEQEGEDVRFYGLEVLQCTQLTSGTLYPLLRRLEETGVVASEMEKLDASEEGRPLRRYYYPNDSEIGEGFWERLKIPEVCDLEPND